MKILVCGASGLLGREICNKFDKENINYIGIYNNNIIEKDNYYNYSKLDEVITNEKPTIIINCIVNRNVDDCENNWNDIKNINIDITDKLSKYSIKIIHISTDYIFDGRNPPYDITSKSNPIQNYGISKLISELRILNNSNNYLIIRVPVLYTDSYRTLDENAITQIGKKLMDLTNKNIYEDDICIRRPVYIPILTNFIYNSIINNYTGIYHFYNPIDKISKYKISLEIQKILCKSNIIIYPTYEIGNRPYDTELIDNKYNIYDYYKNYDFKKQLNLCFKRYYHPIDLKDCFLLIDLDGTLINSEKTHYECYNEVFGLSKDVFDLKNQYNELNFTDNPEDKEKKNKLFKSKICDISLLEGVDIFINYILNNNINYSIVTNTNSENIELYKNNIPILKKLTNWITKNDYLNRKPNPECYKLAINKYYKNEKYIIGIENTLAGYKGLKEITDIIYIILNNNKNIFKNCDAYLINNLTMIYNNKDEK
jgi:dTDP-4-dehydrorhamnose reductase/beta-phosphoglucomutase-like phosphatase (HAD superfamily)